MKILSPGIGFFSGMGRFGSILLVGLSLAGCEGREEPQSASVAPRPVPAGEPAVSDPDREARAYDRLSRKFGRPAPDRSRIKDWARAQVQAIQAHLVAFPRSPMMFKLYQWLIINEIDVLGQYDRAEKSLDAMEKAARTGEMPGAEAAVLRAGRLRVKLFARAGDRAREIVALNRLIPDLSGTERRLMEGRLRELTHLAPGCEMPEFSGTDLQGATVQRKAWSGKVLLLDFWDPGHPASESDFKDRVEAYAEFKNEGLVMVGVPLCRSRSEVKKYIRDRKATWPQLFDKRRPGNDHPLARAFNVVAGPTSYLVDRMGVIRYKGLRGREMLRRIKELVKESRR